jgi:hypothetical protein
MSETLKDMKEQFERDLRNGIYDNVQSVKPSGIDLVESIQIDRQCDYGDAQVSMKSIGVFWGEYISRKTGERIVLDEIDVAHMMELFKINRNAYKRKHDNALDGASYADFVLQFMEAQPTTQRRI